jgi:uncharacterized protein
MEGGAHDGTAAVRAGVLVVGAPAPGGQPARVGGEAGVELLLHGLPVDGAVDVPEPEALAVRLPDLEPRLAIEVTVTADRLSASMRVERVPGARYRLEDQPANREVVVRRLVDERLPCPGPTPDELRDALIRHGVVHGIVADSLVRLARGSSGAEVVARGEPARPARAGCVVFHALPAEGATAPYVRAGALLAELVATDPGEPGVDVYGTPIPPGSAAAVALCVGDGARAAEAGRVVAAVAGHAAVEDGAIVVRDPLVIDGDASGKIVTPGSLSVAGAVTELALLRARGDVLVEGGIRRAAVEAGGSLVVLGGVIDGRLRAGNLQVAARRAAPALAAVATELQRLHAAVVQVLAASHGAGRALPPVRAVALAAQRVAPELDARIAEAFAAIELERGTVDAETATRLRDAAASLADIRVGRRATSTLASLSRAFAEEGAALAAVEGPPLTAVPLLERSTVEVHGVLRLTGRGAIDSTLHVTGLLEADGDGTAIRGGEVVVCGEARIAEAAVRSGELRISLAPGSTLRVGLAHAGVVIDLAGVEHRIVSLTRGLELAVPVARAA